MMINANYQILDNKTNLVKLNLTCPECQSSDLKRIECEISLPDSNISIIQSYRINREGECITQPDNNKQDYIIVTMLCQECHQVYNFLIGEYNNG